MTGHILLLASLCYNETCCHECRFVPKSWRILSFYGLKSCFSLCSVNTQVIFSLCEFRLITSSIKQSLPERPLRVQNGGWEGGVGGLCVKTEELVFFFSLLRLKWSKYEQPHAGILLTGSSETRLRLFLQGDKFQALEKLLRHLFQLMVFLFTGLCTHTNTHSHTIGVHLGGDVKFSASLLAYITHTAGQM